MSEEAAKIVSGLTESQRADLLGQTWYLASCDACGWIGSSQECGTDWGFADDSDVYCPECHRPGCDDGKVANRNEKAVLAILRSVTQ